MSDRKHIAVVLAAGKGKRMGTQTAKQYLLLRDRPLLYYSLRAFQDSFMDEVILVTGEDEIDYCRREIVEQYGLSKVKEIIPGGKERYHSVYQGLLRIQELLQAEASEGDTAPGGASADGTINRAVVYIHDGARPFITEKILLRLKESVEQYGSGVAAMPVKDTIKIADAEGFVTATPDRTMTWQVQTPQCFDFDWIFPAYRDLIEQEKPLLARGVHITDDAMAAELYGGRKVRLVEADYRNIKITTPEDLMIAEQLINDNQSDASLRIH
ncbi:MAG: 2-C-methyl-D-erythritol 4-phosphate cytidylyltransferase [Lachnospiraceae bacterium]|nr:2-C-methyl-D-erythritol 4-phosphate cytidylyltransferase [Lachnospiraceae bacterium]